MDEILRNFAWSDKYSDESFIGLYHETCHWDDDEYFELEDSLYALANKLGGDLSLPRDVVWPIMRIYSYLMLTLGCVKDTNDIFTLEDITDEQFHARRERIQLVFEGFFSGKMPDRNILDY